MSHPHLTNLPPPTHTLLGFCSPLVKQRKLIPELRKSSGLRPPKPTDQSWLSRDFVTPPLPSLEGRQGQLLGRTEPPPRLPLDVR